MSGVTREAERKDHLRMRAEDAAKQAGAMKECPHGTLLHGDPGARGAAYAIGTNMLKAGGIDGTRDEFMDAIKDAIESVGDECSQCAKNAAG